MADFGSGFLSGFMQAQANKRAKAELVMKQQQMNIMMQKAQYELRAMQQEEAWQNGRAVAAKQGGMEGVINYTENTRPEEGLKLRKAQQDYQNSIEEGNYRQSMTTGQDQDNTIKGLTAAGNMYGQLAEMYNKDPKLAQAAYEKNMDMVKAMDPKAPLQFDPDRAAMAMGLAVPQSVKFKAEQDNKQLQTETAQNIHDLQQFNAQGNTMGSQAMLEKIRDNQEKQIKTQRQVQKLDMQIGNISEDQEGRLRAEYTKNTKDYAVMGETIQKMEGLVQSDDINTNPAKQMALVNQYARMNSPGIVTELNEKDAARSPLLAQLWQYKEKIKSGSPLPPVAIGTIRDAMRAQWAGVQPFLKDQDEYYGKLATKYGLNPANVIPSTFKSINKQEAEGVLISDIQGKQPGFSVNKFMEANIKANPGLDDYLKENPEYKSTMIQKYHSQLFGTPLQETAQPEAAAVPVQKPQAPLPANLAASDEDDEDEDN